MQLQFTPYVAPTLAAAVLAGGLALYAWRQRGTTGAVAFAVLMALAAEWSLAYALELSSANLPAKLVWTKLEYVGTLFVPLAWLALALQYTGQGQWVNRRVFGGLAVAPVLLLLAVWTNEWHHLHWSDVSLEYAEGVAFWSSARGPLYWVSIAYSYLLLLAGTVLFVRTVIVSPSLYRSQAATLLVGALVPWCANVLYASGLNPFPHLELAPFALAITGVAYAWALFRFHFLEIVPVARDAVVEGMSDGVIVLDLRNRIVDVNPAALHIIGRPIAQVIGLPADQVLGGRPDLVERYRDAPSAQAEIVLGQGPSRRDYDLRISPLTNRRGRLTGRLIVLRDITERKQVEENLRLAHTIMESAANAIVITDRQGNIIWVNPAFTQLTGYTAQEVIGQNPRVLGSGQHDAAFYRRLWDTITAGQAWRGEIVNRRQDGSLYTEDMTITPVHNQRGEVTHFIAVKQDITRRKAAEAELRSQKQLFENLVAVARATAEGTTLEATLQNMLSVSLALTGAEHGSLFLLDAAGAVTNSILLRPDVTQAQRQSLIGRVMDQGIAGWVARQRQAALIADTTQDERWITLPDEPYTARSVLAAPIVSGGNLIGILTLLHSQANHFDAQHAELIRAAADQMALAARNAQIFDIQRRTADRQITLYEVLKAVSGQLDPQDVAQAAVSAISKLAGWSNVSIALLSQDRRQWSIQAADGLLTPAVGLTRAVGQGVIGRTFKTGQTQNVPDVSVDPDYHAPHPSICSELAVPIQRSGQTVGVLDMESDEPAAFDADDVLLAESLAEAIALALESAWLYTETRQYASDLGALYAVTRATGQSLTLQDILSRALSSIMVTLHFDAGLVSLTESEGAGHASQPPALQVAAHQGLSLSELEFLQSDNLKNTLYPYLQSRRESLTLDNLERQVPAAIRESVADMLAQGWRAYAGIPLAHQNQPLGFINLLARQPRAFSTSIAALLATLGQQVGAAVANARQFAATQTERSRLQALIKSTRDGVILVGLDQRILVLNEQALRLLRLPGAQEEWLGRPLAAALGVLRRYAPGVVRATLAEMRRIQTGDEPPGEGEYEVPPRTLRWLNLPVMSGDKPMGRLLALNDITDERAIERLREDMTRTMVHDLRNPLTGIVTSLGLVIQGVMGELEPQQLEVLQIAEGSARRMSGLVNAILDVSRLESGQMPLRWEMFELPILIFETFQVQSALAKEKGLHLENDAPLTLPPAWADAGLVRRVLQNLVGNAIKFTPPGGTVRVAAKAEKSGDRFVLLISVSDTGAGIPPEIQNRLFQKFVTGRQEGRGSGLGLAFCKLALEAHGERIWAESAEGKGSTFYFTLPIYSTDVR